MSETYVYLSRYDVETINLQVREIIETVEEAFMAKGHGKVEMPPKPGIHPQKDAFIHAMPAFIQDPEAAGMKWVSGFPGNPSKGLPYVTGLIILNDPETGIPISVMDCTWITAKRTAAATAVAAKYLARSESERVGIVACGVQGRVNLEALCTLFPVKSVNAYDLYPETARQYAEEMSSLLSVDIHPVPGVKEAVAGADIVVTSGPILKEPDPLIEPGWLAPGSFACALDFDSYWQGAALSEIDKLATDDINQLNYYRETGYFKTTPEPYADLGQIVTGRKEGRTSDEERTMSMNLGLAIEDMAVATKIYKKALETNAGTRLPL
ncbi:ornithine cyclodeaminase family protein [candidate division KSB1 bacterium]